ncbi:hypothetical protein GCM10022206_56190 [Streptomyces chiangmaiensis]
MQRGCWAAAAWAVIRPKTNVHFYASVLLDAGENIKASSHYLGHTDPGFTLRVYTHLIPSSDARARKALDSLYEGTGPASDGPETAQGARRGGADGARPSAPPPRMPRNPP